jgi:hypothetical protein
MYMITKIQAREVYTPLLDAAFSRVEEKSHSLQVVDNETRICALFIKLVEPGFVEHLKNLSKYSDSFKAKIGTPKSFVVFDSKADLWLNSDGLCLVNNGNVYRGAYRKGVEGDSFNFYSQNNVTTKPIAASEVVRSLLRSDVTSEKLEMNINKALDKLLSSIAVKDKRSLDS